MTAVHSALVIGLIFILLAVSVQSSRRGEPAGRPLVALGILGGLAAGIVLGMFLLAYYGDTWDPLGTGTPLLEPAQPPSRAASKSVVGPVAKGGAGAAALERGPAAGAGGPPRQDRPRAHRAEILHRRDHERLRPRLHDPARLDRRRVPGGRRHRHLDGGPATGVGRRRRYGRTAPGRASAHRSSPGSSKRSMTSPARLTARPETRPPSTWRSTV